MAFDGIVTKAIVSEISVLNGSRIDKIFQPNKNNVILGLYKEGNRSHNERGFRGTNVRVNTTIR